jgi:cytochrome c oxidase subunit 2
VTALTLFVFLVASIGTDRKLAAIEAKPARSITVTGKQWWWDVRYDDERPGNVFHTANEIHVPVGQPVQLQLKSADVIHSLWAPSLGGKKDLIPGRDAALWIQADRAGEFEAQCAEFCGHQHAHMRLLVIAEEPAQFETWLKRQRAPASEPQTDGQRRGRDAFLANTCLMCHTIRGTSAGSHVGPDLTHLAARRTLGAATLSNTREHLAVWIGDPQKFKPGAKMPAQSLAPEDFAALLDYLTNLK